MNKPPTINDIAGALGMHKSTVSLALSGKGTLSHETRQRIKAAARELGYEPNLHAQRLAHGQKNATICIVSGALEPGLATEKAVLLQRSLNAHFQDVPLYTSSGLSNELSAAQAAQMRLICRQRPRAIVCAAQHMSRRALLQLTAYQQGGGIVVTYDTPVPLDCDQVIFDRENNAYSAVRYLLEYGHWKIGIGTSDLDGPPVTSLHADMYDPHADRQTGFQRALAEHGLTLRKEWRFHNPSYKNGGAEMARQFLSLKERPTAVVLVNDYVALAFMIEVLRAGVRVPEELSILGVDNQPLAEYCPVPLTAITQPVDKIVGSVDELAAGRIGGALPPDAPARTVVINSELFHRSSVAVARDRLL